MKETIRTLTEKEYDAAILLNNQRKAFFDTIAKDYEQTIGNGYIEHDWINPLTGQTFTTRFTFAVNRKGNHIKPFIKDMDLYADQIDQFANVTDIRGAATIVYYEYGEPIEGYTPKYTRIG